MHGAWGTPVDVIGEVVNVNPANVYVEVNGVPTSPDALRELADLEEQRRAGDISEGEYHRRRDALLRGAVGSGP